MTSGRKPAGAPADWQERKPAGAPSEAQDEDQLGEQKEAPSGRSASKSDADGAVTADSARNAPNEGGDAGEDASAEAVESDLAALLDDVRRERDEYLELAKRARADFENYRKRASQQATDAERRAKASLARDLIPAIDNLERALEAAGLDSEAADGVEGEAAAGASTATAALIDGVRLVHRELSEALSRAGVTSFDPTGEKFDPASSEALSTQPADGAEPGTVLQVLTRGYRLADQVIRPARVVVAASQEG